MTSWINIKMNKFTAVEAVCRVRTVSDASNDAGEVGKT